jgi:hypothetical protein
MAGSFNYELTAKTIGDQLEKVIQRFEQASVLSMLAGISHNRTGNYNSEPIMPIFQR